MNYKITEHFERGEEKLIAEFNELNEAQLFMTKKSSIDEEKKRRVIYRLYDDDELIHALNKECIYTTHAHYAEGDANFINTAPFMFQVMKQTTASLERKIIAHFNDKNDAYLFIVGQFEASKPIHDNDLYYLFKDKISIDTLNKTIIAHRKAAASGKDGNKEGLPYQLSPLSTRPTPGGGPPDYWVKHEEDNNK